ncbi:4-hydroxy-2-oxo-heptane-1,7-dioate aldolase [compost metagenome]
MDAVFIGPNDLAHAMGHGSDWTAAPVQQAIEQGLKAIASAGKCPGIIALTPADEEKYGALGARYFANVSTSIITRALAQAASAGRDAQLRY